jgi:hypothetical protein
MPSGSARVFTTSIVCGWQPGAATKHCTLALAAQHATAQGHRLGGGRALVEQAAIGDLQAGQLETIVWKLSSASSRPWAISAW